MPTIARALFLAYVLILLPLPSHADMTGKVVGAADGDTLTVLYEREQIKVRLEVQKHCNAVCNA
jgi:endonuclease YncB( thermonuclease family)